MKDPKSRIIFLNEWQPWLDFDSLQEKKLSALFVMSSNGITKNVSFLKNSNNRDSSAYSNTFFCQDWWITRKPGVKTLGTYVTREFKNFDCVFGPSQMVKKSKKGHRFFFRYFFLSYSVLAKSHHYQNRQTFRMLCYPCKSLCIHFIVFWEI